MNLKNIDPRAHIIESQQFDEDFLREMFDVTKYMRNNETQLKDIMKDRHVTLLFYETSTRTRFSFEIAAQRLGASTTMTESATEFSSVSKGETLEDTIRVVSGYTDFIVMRHFEDNAAEQAHAISQVPIINAGSGKSQHPTQALLDVYTIYDHFNKTENLNITVVGDLARGRTVKSLVYLMAKFPNNVFHFVAPDNSRIDQGIKDYLSEHNAEYHETDNLNDTLKVSDIVYMTRVQKERFGKNPKKLTEEEETEYTRARDMYKIDKNNVNLIRKNGILLHPLPRVVEISSEIDHDHRAQYFKQARNGLHVRMALFKMMNDYNYGTK
ncbi:MAG: aspartate carbamoyltransferase [Candidatus Woesearchaeota archaeon]